MQLELLKTDSNSVPMSVAMSAEPISEESQANLGTQFKVLLDVYCSTIDAYIEALTVLQGMEKEIPCKEYISALDIPASYEVEKWKRKAAERVMRRLVVHAQEVFAPGGAGLTIDENPVQERFPIDRDGDLSKFNPAAIWDYLEENYGGKAGQNHAWSQAAETIFKELSLERADKVQRKGEYLVIDRSVYTSKRYSGGMELGHHTADGMRKLFEALVAFASWADKSVLRADLYQFRMQKLAAWEPPVVSRERFGFGVNSLDMVLITYFNRFEYRFRQPIAEKLQIFLATFRTPQE